jgi:hypothetical protein
VQVHYDEGVAVYIGPKPCVGVRKRHRRSVGRGAHRPAIEPRKLKPAAFGLTPCRQQSGEIDRMGGISNAETP